MARFLAITLCLATACTATVEGRALDREGVEATLEPDEPTAGPPAQEPGLDGDHGSPTQTATGRARVPSTTTNDANDANDDRIIVCGGAEVLVLSEARLDEGAAGAVFRWTPVGRSDMPSGIIEDLSGLDECKPLAGSLIAVSSNAGGVAIFDYPSGDVVFHAHVPKAHSVELVGTHLVAVAGAHDHHRVALFDIDRPGELLDEDVLTSAHGLAWDEGREVLWAIGHDQLHVYRVVDEHLYRERALTLPDRGAHDLRPVPGTDDMILSTRGDVWYFDRTTEEFRRHEVIGDAPAVKGVDIHPTTGRLAYVQAETSFWAPRFFLTDPDAEVAMPDHRLYKARWSGGLLADGG